MKIIRVILWLITFASIVAAGSVVFKTFKIDMTEYRLGKECTQRLVEKGIKEKDIKVIKGRCYVIAYKNPRVINPQPNVNYGIN